MADLRRQGMIEATQIGFGATVILISVWFLTKIETHPNPEYLMVMCVFFLLYGFSRIYITISEIITKKWDIGEDAQIEEGQL